MAIGLILVQNQKVSLISRLWPADPTCIYFLLQNQSTIQVGASPPIMALISLEDLEGLDDEQLDDDITDNPEPMEEDDRLLSHWQAVASTHQVSVPPGEFSGSNYNPSQ